MAASGERISTLRVELGEARHTAAAVRHALSVSGQYCFDDLIGSQLAGVEQLLDLADAARRDDWTEAWLDRAQRTLTHARETLATWTSAGIA